MPDGHFGRVADDERTWTILWTRRIKSILFRVAFFFSDHRWIVLSVILGSVGVAAIWVDLPFGINIALAAITLVMLTAEVRRYVDSRNEVDFPPRSADRFTDVEEALEESPRFDFWRTPTGCFIADTHASTAISNGAVTATLAHQPYEVPPELVEYGTLFQRRRSSGIDFYDGHVLGFKTDLGRGEFTADHVTLTPARYRDHLATDAFAMHDVIVGRHHRGEYGRRLFVDRRSRLRDHGSSWLLNAIGTSAIALTADGQILAVHQSTKNDSSGGLLAPGGSGSLEARDFGGAREAPLHEVFAAGALRELNEEAGIHAGDVADHAFLGYGRWVDRAGKPEGFTLVFLSVDSHTALRRVIPSIDRPFSLRAQALRIDLDAPGWTPEHAEMVVVDQGARTRLSLPLWAGISMLTRAARDSEHRLHGRIRAVVDRDD